jgi:hypothetical protein
MRKIYIHFEEVPVVVVEKILQKQESLAKRNGNRKRVVKKSGKARSETRARRRKAEVLKP